jgi:hypothetical protein
MQEEVEMKNLGSVIAFSAVLFGWAAGTGADHPDKRSDASSGHREDQGVASTWIFDDAETERLPEGWRAEGTNQRGPVATWIVKADTSAPSKPNVLALTDTKEGWGGTFNLCWTDHVKFKDGVIEVKVKAGTGREDQGGGLIWRLQDKDNYYITRWNPLEDNFRLYSVKDGSRKILESARVKADPSKWHTIRIEHMGDEIKCYFDNEALKTVQDNTFPAGGGVGVWTKADAVTAFDDLEVKGPAAP